MQEILGDNTMLDSRADPNVPFVFAVASKMSSNPTSLNLFRNYNYNKNTSPDNFVINPEDAIEILDLDTLSDYENIEKEQGGILRRRRRKRNKIQKEFHKKLLRRTAYSEKNSEADRAGSRHPGSFRVSQKVALRASTAAPTVFKPLLMGGELYCDGGIGECFPIVSNKGFMCAYAT